MRLDGKVAIVTGAASGIGAAAARRFLAEGARVALADMSGDAVAAVAKELGAGCIAVRCDHCSNSDCESLVETVLREWGRLDILYNNAAGTGKASFEETTEPQLRGMLDGALIGPWQLTQAALAALKAAAAGSRAAGAAILFTGSRVSAIGAAGNSPYIIAKHAVLGLVRSLAADLGPLNIRVNAVCPGIVPTPRVMQATAWGSAEVVLERYLQRTPLGRITTADDIAATALFLVSDDARAISGQAVYVDGGMSAI